MSSGNVRDGELTKVVAGHLRLDLNLVESLTVVDTDDRSDHLGDDDHITKMSLDRSRLLIGGSVLLGNTELLNETHGLAVKTTSESAAGTSMDNLAELLSVKLKEIRKVNTTVGELLEVSLLAVF